MKRKLFVFPILVLLVFCQYRVNAQVAISFLAGPNYSYFIQSKSDYRANAYPGWGFDAGLQLKSGDDHFLSFKALLGYSLQIPRIKLPNFVSNEIYHYSYLEGTYWLSNIIFFPQLQFNFLEKKNLFLGVGPFCQVRIAGYGKGTYNYGNTPEGQSFSGNEIISMDKIFSMWNAGPGVSLGYQKFRIGKICLFFELREVWLITNYFRDDSKNGWSPKATWIDLLTSLNIGLDFYRK